MKYREIKSGLVIELPDTTGQLGVILDATHYNTNLYKVTVLMDSSDIMVAKLRIEENDYLHYLDYSIYNTSGIISNLLSKEEIRPLEAI